MLLGTEGNAVKAENAFFFYIGIVPLDGVHAAEILTDAAVFIARCHIALKERSSCRQGKGGAQRAQVPAPEPALYKRQEQYYEKDDKNGSCVIEFRRRQV